MKKKTVKVMCGICGKIFTINADDQIDSHYPMPMEYGCEEYGEKLKEKQGS
ncbi:MAG: hypothetical protein ACD_56C00088G0006 [uncultured bacterium]|nr:MAG: hypothetical protein ACD_56C00088G0006 [uncultured bacterium]KKQ44607.1 MAG: hypothetical protein US63_C0025G0012 [Candidatus Moranbacteria bacterium GW2011_GWC2_37_8]KKQ63241.1 MAG: hypothetical protein US82_C0002G0036 [Parcubacteria group bacterium GW2011_GWC1_38_22]KKQ79605.1 MAG: hypothetical protein UT03_C0047G0006 [Candidatus Moranbacteria bacterium GW2011_GWD2_38_7]